LEYEGSGYTIGSRSDVTDQPTIGSDGRVVRSSGIWARDKLYYLKRYLDIFSVGMRRRWPGKLYYVDLFAGPGRCLIRDSSEEIDGSPLIALKYAFDKYIFFETDELCRKALAERIESRAPEKLVEIVPADCNQEIDRINPLPGSLGLAFIDPTGVSPLKFETMRTLTANRRIDLIINFHEGMGIRMNMHQYMAKEDSALDTFVGSHRWREKFDQDPTSLDQLCQAITDEYRDNLRTLGYKIVDGTQIPIRAQNNILLYYLLFASKHPRGNEFWEKIGAIDPHGQRRFPNV
jgi:three-Cys-motif partner protein